jgi:hypothetical protein
MRQLLLPHAAVNAFQSCRSPALRRRDTLAECPAGAGTYHRPSDVRCTAPCPRAAASHSVLQEADTSQRGRGGSPPQRRTQTLRRHGERAGQREHGGRPDDHIRSGRGLVTTPRRSHQQRPCSPCRCCRCQHHHCQPPPMPQPTLDLCQPLECCTHRPAPAALAAAPVSARRSSSVNTKGKPPGPPAAALPAPSVMPGIATSAAVTV